MTTTPPRITAKSTATPPTRSTTRTTRALVTTRPLYFTIPAKSTKGQSNAPLRVTIRSPYPATTTKKHITNITTRKSPWTLMYYGPMFPLNWPPQYNSTNGTTDLSADNATSSDVTLLDVTEGIENFDSNFTSVTESVASEDDENDRSWSEPNANVIDENEITTNGTTATAASSTTSSTTTTATATATTRKKLKRRITTQVTTRVLRKRLKTTVAGYQASKK
ncbi:uncharacterized protein LOC131428384 [Malaya genurostris]|uniref:uncharacterized protein LOC131428384 n=1 Tax=Malaya genurostris TaxID=325434 RepID=UPI0026F3E779|nr:uncharacterized protein LOC131428384 [Malaya genurostris]